MGAVILGADGHRIHSRHERGAAGRTDSGDGECVGVAHPGGGELIERGGFDLWGSVTAELRAHVFSDDPEDVGLGVLSGGWRSEQDKKQQES